MGFSHFWDQLFYPATALAKGQKAFEKHCVSGKFGKYPTELKIFNHGRFIVLEKLLIILSG